MCPRYFIEGFSFWCLVCLVCHVIVLAACVQFDLLESCVEVAMYLDFDEGCDGYVGYELCRMGF